MQLGVTVRLDDLHHVRVGVAAPAIADVAHLAQQEQVVLPGEPRIELPGLALAVLTVALTAVFVVELLAARENVA